MSLLIKIANHHANAVKPPPNLLPSEWGRKNYVVTKGPAAGKKWNPAKGWEFQIGILDGLYGPLEPGEEMREGVLFKGAKAGCTLVADIGTHYWPVFRRQSAAMVAPRKPDSIDRAAESERSIAASPTLRRAFLSRKGRTKQANYGAQLIYRSAETDRDLVDWGAMVITGDERDRWAQQNFNPDSMLDERQGGYHERIRVNLSTPTVPDYGVHRLFEISDQRYYSVPCPLMGCRHRQFLKWEDNIAWNSQASTFEAKVLSARFICQKCGKTWNRFNRMAANGNGEWVKKQRERLRRGFSISRLYVPTALAREFVDKWLKGQSDVGELREFYNQKLGMPFLSSVGDLDSAAVQRCITSELEWGKRPSGYDRVFAGVDVQGGEDPFEFFWEIRAYNDNNDCAVIDYGVSRGNDELRSVLGRSYGNREIERALIDITDGHHRIAVEEAVKSIPCLEAARFDWKAKVSFQRVKRERQGQKKTDGVSGWAVEREGALDDNLTRFFEQSGKKPSIAIARNPKAGREKEFVSHYTGIRRMREETKDGPRYVYKKKRAEGVDYPFAGALAEISRQVAGSSPGSGHYGSINKIAKPMPVPSSSGTRKSVTGVRVIGKNRRF